ncbi:hypothetical protein [Paraburkholderia sediminicola]|uniref:hypothetical protein n=1 Tax=Paraburkholderia sediminicola TaxID=458836 RepID=UPI0038BA7052
MKALRKHQAASIFMAFNSLVIYMETTLSRRIPPETVRLILLHARAYGPASAAEAHNVSIPFIESLLAAPVNDWRFRGAIYTYIAVLPNEVESESDTDCASGAEAWPDVMRGDGTRVPFPGERKQQGARIVRPGVTPRKKPLNENEMAEIQKLLAARVAGYLIAAQFGVSPTVISRIKNGRYSGYLNSMCVAHPKV